MDSPPRRGSDIPADPDRPGSAPERWLPLVVLLPAIAAGLVWRLAPVGDALLQGDEVHSLKHLEPGYAYLLTHFDLTGSGMLLPLLQRLLLDSVGLGHWTLRAPAWLPGIALPLLTWPLVRSGYGRACATVATALVAVNPLLVFYSHFGRAYALVTLGCFAFFALVQRSLARGRLDRRSALAIAALCALLPYAHPASVGFLAPVGLAGALALAIERRPRCVARLAAAGGAGALVALLLHLPALDSVQAVAERSRIVYAGSFDLFDVVALMTGSIRLREPVVWVTLAAAVALLFADRQRALPLLAGCFGPVAALWLTHPYGEAYAWARYAMPLVPCVAVLWGRCLELLCERALPRFRAREVLGVGAAAALALTFVALGPLGPNARPQGPYANTYLGMLALPEFDRVWPGTPRFYRELAELARRGEARRIVEVPALYTQARHLYRSYWLLHGLDTWLAWNPHELAHPPEGPYLALHGPGWADDIDQLTRAPADYLILHKHIGRELREYFAHLYGRPAGDGTNVPERRAYMHRHRHYGGFRGPLKPALAKAVERELGPPVFEDRHILVWRLAGADP